MSDAKPEQHDDKKDKKDKKEKKGAWQKFVSGASKLEHKMASAIDGTEKSVNKATTNVNGAVGQDHTGSADTKKDAKKEHKEEHKEEHKAEAAPAPAPAPAETTAAAPSS